MTPNHVKRNIAVLAGVAAMLGMGALTACGSTAKEEKPPATVTDSPATNSPATPAPSPGDTAPASPSEKRLSPDAPNSFSPTVKAPHAPTAEPG